MSDKLSVITKNIIKIIFLSCLLFFVFNSSANADSGWVINNFDSSISIEKDGTVFITEKILADFATNKHGIIREIPYVYSNEDGSNFYTKFEIVNVEMDGNSMIYENYKDYSNQFIKIGDADKLISGEHEYLISYIVTGVLKSYNGFDEFYWNATGEKWDIPILNTSANIKTNGVKIIQTDCYEGYRNEQGGCFNEKKSGDNAFFKAKGTLSPGQGMTIVVGFEQGMIPILKNDSTLFSSFRNILLSRITQFSALVLILAGIFILIINWWLKGRDQWIKRKSIHDPDQKEEIMPLGANEPIYAEYESPKGLKPAEIGVLLKERVDNLDISATIVDLAVRGYIKIEEVKKEVFIFSSTDYVLKKTKDYGNELLNYEKKLLGDIFEKKDEMALSELSGTFYKKIKKIKDFIYEESISKNLFYKNPEKVRTKYAWIGVAITIISFVLLFASNFVISENSLFGEIISGILLGFFVVGIIGAIFSKFMPKRTAYGRELLRKVKGYKLFVSGTEKYRQPFFEKENTFMEVLPYAIIFGVTKKLSEAMKVMGLKPADPVWFSGSSAFNIGAFASSMNNFSNSFSASISSAPSSSGIGGGGSSGGGFGGGGGSSW